MDEDGPVTDDSSDEKARKEAMQQLQLAQTVVPAMFKDFMEVIVQYEGVVPANVIASLLDTLKSHLLYYRSLN